MLIEGAALVIGIAIIYFIRKPYKAQENMNNLTLFEDQSVLEPGPERIRRSKVYQSENGEMLKCRRADIRTLYDCFCRGAVLSNNGPCLGWRGGPNRTYVWQSYNDTLLRAKNFGSGLISLGLPPGQTSFIGIYLRNCPEWIMTELAACTFSMILVPIYDTLGAQACVFIMNQVKLKVIVCENEEKAKDLIEASSPYLETIVTLKPISSLTKELAKNYNISLYTFAEVEELGEKNVHPCVPPKPEDISTICYTSGTTGEPKGVILTHANFVANNDSVHFQIGQVDEFVKDDVILSFLPLAHGLERVCEQMVYGIGARVGFYSGDLQNVVDDIAELKPTIFIAVPRLLNKIYDKTITTVSKSKLKKILLNMALSSKEKELKRGIFNNGSIRDRFVFQKIRDSLGGRIRMVISSAAPLSENVQTFVRCALGCKIIEAYGQTESLCVTLNFPGDPMPGHVGSPMPCCKVKLVDVPDMEYYAKNDQGEVCVKGNQVFKGYYLNPEKTKEAFDEDGWLHTGDIGMWLPNGALRIVDRRKQIFKLSQGEYIAPEKIENAYLRSLFVEQILIFGESLKSSLVAIVVPSREAVIDWAVAHEIAGPFSTLCEDPRVKNAIIEDMLRKGKMADLKSFEQVKDIYLHPDLFSVQNGLLTPTMKIKRREVVELFKKNIEEMYKLLA